jgi:hypothetical protein
MCISRSLRILIHEIAGILGIGLDAAQPINVGQVAPARHHPVVRGFGRVGMEMVNSGNQIVADALARANRGKIGGNQFLILERALSAS